MFSHLRKKLTQINLVVMGLLCLLMVSGTYLAMRMIILDQSQQLLQIIASEMGSTNNQNFNQDRHIVVYFYVKTDSVGNVVEQSPNIPLDEAGLSDLVHMVQIRSALRGRVHMRDESYAYLRVPVPLPPNNGQLLAFVRQDRDQDILQFLLLTLTIVGLIYLVLAYFGGRFLADRAILPISRAWQRQQDFVADASHELRTPLAVIQTNIELVKGNPEETVANQFKWLDYIDLETKRLTKLVNDLLFLARADSNQNSLETSEFSLSVVVENTIELFRPLSNHKGVDLRSAIVEEILINGEENKIRQLMVILLDNALKHTPIGGVIHVELQRSDNCDRIIVSDTGEGIALEHLPHIFDRFYRVDKARSKQTGGTGLGLAIAQWITHSHSGVISATSRPGENTVFTVTLPRFQTKRQPKTHRFLGLFNRN